MHPLQPLPRLRTCVLLTLALAFAPTSSATSLFSTHFETLRDPLGGFTWYPVVGDLDLDGRDDLIRMSEGSLPCVLVRFGEADGRLSGVPIALPYVFGTSFIYSLWPCIDDIDGDGIPDIVIGGETQLVVIRGLGGRAFAPAVSLPEPCWGYVSTADLNGDSIPDFAYVDQPFIAPDSVRIRFGTGNLGFTPGPAFEVRGRSEGVHLADFNGDSLPDIFVGADTTSTLLLNLGGGAFTPFAVAADEAFPAGDLDGNGFEDLVSRAGAHLNNGDGTFQPAMVHGMTAPQCTADLNEDGRLDLIGLRLQSSVRYVTIMLGHGDGTFGSESLHRTSYYAEVVSHGDFDQDGHEDLVLLKWDSDSEIYMFGRGTGVFPPAPRWFPTGLAGAIYTGNLGPSPHPDIVIRGSSSPLISVLLNTGPAEYAAPTTYSTLAMPYTLALGDLDSDGRDDVVVGYRYLPMRSVWLTQPGGAIGPRMDAPNFGGTFRFRLADLDDNGTLDLISRIVVDNQVEVGEDSTSWWSPGNGDGTFGIPIYLPGGLSSEFEVLDFDGNGALDIVSSGAVWPPFVDMGAVRIFLASSPGVFPGFADYENPLESSGITYFGTGYFDADSIPDVVAARDSVYIYPGLGSGAVGPRLSLGAGPGTVKAVADLNADGLTDLVGYITASLSTGVSFGTGERLAPSIGYGARLAVTNLGSQSSLHAIADVDGNGAPDIIVGDRDVPATGMNSVALLVNQTITPNVGVPPVARPGTRLAARVAPNPTVGRAALQLELVNTAPVEVQLFDLAGRRVSSASLARPEGLTVRVPLDGTERLAPGLYLVRVRQGAETATARVCLMR